MSELPDGIPPATPPEPRSSASVIVLRRGDPGWEVLLGRRSRRSRFMPGHLAFPGGALEASDRPGTDGAHRRCAARELREETAVVIPPERLTDAGERTTPPMFPVRFRTRFYVALTDDPALEPAPATPENEILEFVRPAQVLRDWSTGRSRVPPPLLPLLRVLCAPHEDSVERVAEALARANALEEDAPRIEFAPGLWMLPVETATMPPATHTNVWLPGGSRFAVIDPGSGDAQEQARLLRVVERRREAGGEPVAVLLTHHHQDHATGAADIARVLGVPLRAHARALALAGLTACGRPIDDGEEIDLGGVTLRAVLTPGHAPGHLAFHLPDERLLIAGDLVSGISTILIEPRHGEMGAYLASLERARDLGCRMLLPGHGAPLPATELERVLDHRRKRERTILDRLSDDPVPLGAIAEAAYAETPDVPAALTERQTLSHLLWLERRQLARRADDAASWLAAGRELPEGERIERVLRERFDPLYFELRDDSAKHVGHPGATSGGGHYHVVIVAAAFEGRSRIEQHRLVNEALAGMFGETIHALGLTTRAPSEPDAG